MDRFDLMDLEEAYETEWRLYTRAERVGDRKAKKLHGDRFQELLKQLQLLNLLRLLTLVKYLLLIKVLLIALLYQQ